MTSKPTRELSEQIRGLAPADPPVSTRLDTSSQVIRRVTDGIYRKPWSAIRELVSNAYDADATHVVIETDQPRFETMTIRDDGVGFSSESLAHMIKNIGGSAKRQDEGVSYGLASPSNKLLTNGGRRIIGKLGIGLFAVSQLTHEFSVITKRKDDAFRTCADVILFRLEEGASGSQDGASQDGRSDLEEPDFLFHTGSVKIYKVPASDKSSQGTIVTLRKLLPATVSELRSERQWAAAESEPEEDNGRFSADSPRFHIGKLSDSSTDEYGLLPSLPWDEDDEPLTKFEKLASEFCDVYSSNANLRPSIEGDLDSYLQFLWSLSLAAPIEYLWKHPFDVDSSDGLRVYKLANRSRQGAEEIDLGSNSVRECFGLSENGASSSRFKVFVDDVELRRPLGINTRALDELQRRCGSGLKPLLFIGQYNPDLSGVPDTVRGGELRLESYLLWRERTTPKEHAGVLIRVNGASGTLFDSTFLDYRVAEIQRKQQATMEVFVSEGLDAALNIDRETFNTFHPHYQILREWIHQAFRQFATRDKGIRKDLRSIKLDTEFEEHTASRRGLAQKLVNEWDETATLPTVRFESPLLSKLESSSEELFLDRDAIFGEVDRLTARSDASQRQTARQIAVMESIAAYMQSVGLLEGLGRKDQERVLSDLFKIIFSEDLQ